MSIFEQKLVTPEEAQELLNLVAHEKQQIMQRPIKKDNVAKLVRKIKNGKFQDVSLVHLIYCEEDQLTYLVNGQHTLHAVIRAKVPVTLTIRRDIYKTQNEVKTTYMVTDHSWIRRAQDTHRASNLHNELGISLAQIGLISSAIRFIRGNFSKAKSADDIEMEGAIRLYAEPFKLFKECNAGGDSDIIGKLYNQGYLSVILLTFKYEPEKAKDFWEMVCHGNYTGSRFHPASVLLKKIPQFAVGGGVEGSEKTKKVPSRILARAASLAWSAYIDKREIKNFKIPDRVVLKNIPINLAQEEINQILKEDEILMDNSTDFSKIEYYPKPHLYKYEGNIPLTSVTKFVSSLYPPFDRQGIAEKKAKELGIPVQQVLSNWSEAGQKGRELGTTVHDYIQQKLDGIAIDELRYRLNGSTPLEFDAFDKYYDRIRQEGMRPIWVEKIIGDIDYKLAGMVDCLFLHPQDGYILTDWKTGKIEEWNTQKFNPPFEKIPCDDLYKYSFQLSLYKLIIERNTDIKISKMHIVHLFGDEYNVYPGIDYGPDLDPYLKGR